MGDIAISAKNLKKSYRKYKSNFQKIQFLLFMRDAGEKIRVLKDVSFDINRGEKVGIIGGPSSGKSTLLRILADVIKPDSGSVTTEGEITAILDNRLGFDNALSGETNYQVRCRILGWDNETIKKRRDWAFRFAGLTGQEKEKMRNYRAGDANRLGFAISTAHVPEILLYDEKFAFGGKRYTNRAIRRLKKITAGGEITLVMTVNSNASICEELCDRGLVLHKGKIAFDGSFDEAVEYYSANCLKRKHKKAQDDDRDENSDIEKIRDSESEGENEAEENFESEETAETYEL